MATDEKRKTKPDAEADVTDDDIDAIPADVREFLDNLPVAEHADVNDAHREFGVEQIARLLCVECHTVRRTIRQLNIHPRIQGSRSLYSAEALLALHFVLMGVAFPEAYTVADIAATLRQPLERIRYFIQSLRLQPWLLVRGTGEPLYAAEQVRGLGVEIGSILATPRRLQAERDALRRFERTAEQGQHAGHAELSPEVLKAAGVSSEAELTDDNFATGG